MTTEKIVMRKAKRVVTVAHQAAPLAYVAGQNYPDSSKAAEPIPKPLKLKKQSRKVKIDSYLKSMSPKVRERLIKTNPVGWVVGKFCVALVDRSSQNPQIHFSVAHTSIEAAREAIGCIGEKAAGREALIMQVIESMCPVPAIPAAAAKCCPQCDDGDGNCAFPYYGVAPHTHAPGPILGSTRMTGVDSWPANFQPDAEEDNTAGTYTHCLSCGRPNAE